MRNTTRPLRLEPRRCSLTPRSADVSHPDAARYEATPIAISPAIERLARRSLFGDTHPPGAMATCTARPAWT